MRLGTRAPEPTHGGVRPSSPCQGKRRPRSLLTLQELANEPGRRVFCNCMPAGVRSIITIRVLPTIDNMAALLELDAGFPQYLGASFISATHLRTLVGKPAPPTSSKTELMIV
ncbi:hypothetical protein CRG98_017158 [Punica granatum]|uniref:Uncharacterized protein n=1 Tax=Punica granatum TaxID=22663 RepID=A0A2I0K1C3_PUNGR|nr:hypothetical protein CRG98_017158 [Punica granatum]